MGEAKTPREAAVAFTSENHPEWVIALVEKAIERDRAERRARPPFLTDEELREVGRRRNREEGDRAWLGSGGHAWWNR